jgi:hypothetical protein
MKGIITVSIVVAFSLDCGPEVDDDDHEPFGELVYEHPASAFYRLDRRVEVIPLDPMLSRYGCGFLSDRAHDEIATTVAALDPTVDYGGWSGCRQNPELEGKVYLEGFEHSPFLCDWDCCHPDLGRVALVYFLVENAFHGLEFIVGDDDEPYVAIEPDRPCEPES